MAVVEAIQVSRGEDITLHMRRTPKKDITGWVISMTVSEYRNSPVKLFQVTAVITSGPNATFDVIMTSANLNREPGTFWYDQFRVNPGNNRLLREGPFIITGNAKLPV